MEPYINMCMHVSLGVYARGLLLCAYGTNAEKSVGFIETDVAGWKLSQNLSQDLQQRVYRYTVIHTEEQAL